ncbi:MAG TPA: M3 family metallopeptidase [Steroidobacteraceae bacterium]|nr:M3 family metallopeptidase [Steroidobacteraceae bacterium]
MKSLILLSAAATALTAVTPVGAFAAAAGSDAGSGYHFDTKRYLFRAPADEQARRIELLAEVHGFLKQPASSLDTPPALARWLTAYDSLSKRLNRHDLYVYLRSEEDTNDHADAAADDTLQTAIAKLESTARSMLTQIGAGSLHRYLASDTSLGAYRYFIDSNVARTAHETPCAAAGALLTAPVLESLTGSYKSLADHLPPVAASQPSTGAAAFAARWKPYLENEDRFASLLVPILRLHEGEARLQGFEGAPAAAYSRDQLTTSEVNGALAAVRGSDGYERYIAVLVAAASRRLHVVPAALHAWDLDRADTYRPARVPFPDALRLILASEQPMGAAYAGQFARLFDPFSGRLEWCRAETCDRAGFSLGYAGVTSGLFYGSYTGDVNSVRALAHEAGHAVHRQLMAENQPLAVYNEGPKFIFESFAIFNGFLALDHLYRTARSPAARAYYLNRFLDDATFEVWGSARETDLEQSMYAAAERGKLHDAADLDALTLWVFRRYMPRPALDPRMRVYWAHDRLYFTDPNYDVNYLFAGLLALEYMRQFERDPKGFAPRYLALLRNGFSATPQELEKTFLGIDLEAPAALVKDAAQLIGRRADVLERLYAALNDALPAPRHDAPGTRAGSVRTGV